MKTKVGQKQVRKVTNMLMDGLGVADVLTHGGKRTIGRVQDSG